MAVNNLLNLESVSKSFDIRALLDGVSLGVNSGDRIGIVGRNGEGLAQLVTKVDIGYLTSLHGVKQGALPQLGVVFLEIMNPQFAKCLGGAVIINV